MPAVVRQFVHAAPTGATEYCPAVQFVQVVVSPVDVHEPALRVPAAQTVQGVHAVALAADQLTPAVQVEHLVLAVVEHVEERKLPAAQTLDAQALQGA